MFAGTLLSGVVPPPPQLLLILPAICLVLGLFLIMAWIRKTARAIDAKKREAALAAAAKKGN